MAERSVMMAAGLFLLGLVLLAVGFLIEPARTATPNISEAGESLIALGLTFVFVSIGYFLAWAMPSS